MNSKNPVDLATLRSLLRTRADEHFSRKIFHIATGTAVGCLFASSWMTRTQAGVALICVGAFLAGLDLLRLRIQPLNRLILRVYGPLMRENEFEGPSGQLYYVLGLAWAILLLPKTLALQAIFTLAWMDPLAAMIGLRFGRRTWVSVFERVWVDPNRVQPLLGAKTVEGSMAGWIAAFLAGIIAWTGPWAAVRLPDRLWWPDPVTVLMFAAFGGVVAVIAEAWPSQWDDNVNIPFWSGLALWVLAIAWDVPIRF